MSRRAYTYDSFGTDVADVLRNLLLDLSYASEFRTTKVFAPWANRTRRLACRTDTSTVPTVIGFMMDSL